MSENYIEIISEDKLYPIVRSKKAEEAIEISKALVEGGIRLLEINVENPSLFQAVNEVSKFAHVCAGGIITMMQVNAAIESGAHLFSSPIYHMNMVKVSKNKRLPFIAGASTANEAYNAWKARIPLIKLFPAEAMGGVQYIEDIHRQMPFLNLMPMGNIKLADVVKYINAGAVAVGVGRDFYQGFTPKEITARTKEILREVKDFTQWNQK